MLQLIITYLWFGLSLPEKYAIELSEADYPFRFHLVPFFNTLLSFDTIKADQYILQSLRGGGIYCDIHNKITNYNLLMEKLNKFEGQLAVIQIDSDGYPEDSFMYVPKNKTNLINKIYKEYPVYSSICLRQEEQNDQKCGIKSLLKKYRDRISVLDLEDCIRPFNKQSHQSKARPQKQKTPIIDIFIKYFQSQKNEQLKQKQMQPFIKIFIIISTVMVCIAFLWLLYLTISLFITNHQINIIQARKLFQNESNEVLQSARQIRV